MTDPRKYSICVRLSEEPEGPMFCATVRELPDVAVYDDSAVDAYEGAIAVIGDLQSSFERKGKPFPDAIGAPVEASGRTTLRMSKSLHAAVAEAAAADDISLNQWIVESMAWRLRGERVAVVHAPNAISVTCNVDGQQRIILNTPPRAIRSMGECAVLPAPEKV